MTNTTERPPVTAELARFASTLDWDRVPREVRSFMPILLIDAFRAAAIGFDRPWTRAIFELHRGSRGAANASVLSSDARIEATRAAFVNAVACGSVEWDDSHVTAILHGGPVVWPAALAMAEVTGANGAELLTAALIGYETAIRIGISIQPEHSLRGFQATSTCGVFGAAAACARLLKLGPERTQHALGIAASFASGLSQFFVSGSDVKRVHPANAATGGMQAALLANAGLTGPHDAIEGAQGFARAYSDRFDAQAALHGLGTEFPTRFVSLKPHAGSVRLQAAIEAAAILAREGVTPEHVRGMEIGVHPAMVGKLTTTEPRDAPQAQLSAPFAAAMAIALAPARGATLVLSTDDFETCVHDEHIRALSARTTCTVDAEVERLTTADGVPARVKCVLNDGTTRETFVKSFKGSPQNPLTIDEACDRFRRLAVHRFDHAGIQSWLDTARTIESRANVAGLFALRPRRPLN